MSGPHSRSETPTQPSPLAVGTRFVKQYYHTLSTAPDKLRIFYQNSAISFGNGSSPSEEGADPVQRWKRGGSTDSLSFDFNDGAIDAQMSVNGGILLVVTGHALVGPQRIAFWHAFFLAVAGVGGSKKSYYVQNDILRFLDDNSSINGVAAVATTAAVVPDPAPATVVAPEQPTPGGGVEETKDDELTEALLDLPASTAALELTEAPMDLPAVGAAPTGVSVDAAPETPRRDNHQATEKPSTPGSWASLVAHNSTSPATATAVAPTNTAPTKAASPVRQAKPPKPAPTSSTTAPPVKRDPDMTLVIKNFAPTTTTQDILAIFEPFAANNNAQVVGCTVSTNKGVAFVDFDSVAPVLAVVESHAQQSIATPDGRVLDVYQKTLERRPKKPSGGGRGYRRSGSGSGRGGRGSGRGGRLSS